MLLSNVEGFSDDKQMNLEMSTNPDPNAKHVYRTTHYINFEINNAK